MSSQFLRCSIGNSQVRFKFIKLECFDVKDGALIFERASSSYGSSLGWNLYISLKSVNRRHTFAMQSLVESHILCG
jgi:hypothetical protein